jgi:hypothetical protein
MIPPEQIQRQLLQQLLEIQMIPVVAVDDAEERTRLWRWMMPWYRYTVGVLLY